MKTWDSGVHEGSEADELQKRRRREKGGGKQKWNGNVDGMGRRLKNSQRWEGEKIQIRN